MVSANVGAPLVMSNTMVLLFMKTVSVTTSPSFKRLLRTPGLVILNELGVGVVLSML